MREEIGASTESRDAPKAPIFNSDNRFSTQIIAESKRSAPSSSSNNLTLLRWRVRKYDYRINLIFFFPAPKSIRCVTMLKNSLSRSIILHSIPDRVRRGRAARRLAALKAYRFQIHEWTMWRADDGPTEALLFSIATFSGRRWRRRRRLSLCIRGEPRAMTLQRRLRSDSQWIWSRFVSSRGSPN